MVKSFVDKYLNKELYYSEFKSYCPIKCTKFIWRRSPPFGWEYRSYTLSYTEMAPNGIVYYLYTHTDYEYERQREEFDKIREKDLSIFAMKREWYLEDDAPASSVLFNTIEETLKDPKVDKEG